MICYQSGAPDCFHLIKTAPMSCMSPKRNQSDIDLTHPFECSCYEPGKMTTEQANERIIQHIKEGFARIDKLVIVHDAFMANAITRVLPAIVLSVIVILIVILIGVILL